MDKAPPPHHSLFPDAVHQPSCDHNLENHSKHDFVEPATHITKAKNSESHSEKAKIPDRSVSTTKAASDLKEIPKKVAIDIIKQQNVNPLMLAIYMGEAPEVVAQLKTISQPEQLVNTVLGLQADKGTLTWKHFLSALSHCGHKPIAEMLASSQRISELYPAPDAQPCPGNIVGAMRQPLSLLQLTHIISPEIEPEVLYEVLAHSSHFEIPDNIVDDRERLYWALLGILRKRKESVDLDSEIRLCDLYPCIKRYYFLCLEGGYDLPDKNLSLDYEVQRLQAIAEHPVLTEKQAFELMLTVLDTLKKRKILPDFLRYFAQEFSLTSTKWDFEKLQTFHHFLIKLKERGCLYPAILYQTVEGFFDKKLEFTNIPVALKKLRNHSIDSTEALLHCFEINPSMQYPRLKYARPFQVTPDMKREQVWSEPLCSLEQLAGNQEEQNQFISRLSLHWRFLAREMELPSEFIEHVFRSETALEDKVRAVFQELFSLRKWETSHLYKVLKVIDKGIADSMPAHLKMDVAQQKIHKLEPKTCLRQKIFLNIIILPKV